MKDDLRHSFLIDASPAAIADALTQAGRLRRWWTREAQVEQGRGRFGFGRREVEFHMERDDAAGTVAWKCVGSNMQDTDAWQGTTVGFTLTPQGEGTRLDFALTGYRDSPLREVCTLGWAWFLGTSLKQYLETGKGSPYIPGCWTLLLPDPPRAPRWGAAS